VRQQINEINCCAYQSHQIKNEVKYLMLLCPHDPAGGVDGMGCEIPMEIIAADSGEEDKAYQSFRGWDAEQQPARLPDHQHGTQGNIKTAENEIVEYFL